MAMGESFSSMNSSLRMVPTSTSKAALEETPLPLGTLEVIYTSRPDSCAPRWTKAAQVPRRMAALVFSSDLRGARSSRLMVHRG